MDVNENQEGAVVAPVHRRNGWAKIWKGRILSRTGRRCSGKSVDNNGVLLVGNDLGF